MVKNSPLWIGPVKFIFLYHIEYLGLAQGVVFGVLIASILTVTITVKVWIKS